MKKSYLKAFSFYTFILAIGMNGVWLSGATAQEKPLIRIRQQKVFKDREWDTSEARFVTVDDVVETKTHGRILKMKVSKDSDLIIELHTKSDARAQLLKELLDSGGPSGRGFALSRQTWQVVKTYPDGGSQIISSETDFKGVFGCIYTSCAGREHDSGTLLTDLSSGRSYSLGELLDSMEAAQRVRSNKYGVRRIQKYLDSSRSKLGSAYESRISDRAVAGATAPVSSETAPIVRAQARSSR
jgi:hypothetical protein